MHAPGPQRPARQLDRTELVLSVLDAGYWEVDLATGDATGNRRQFELLGGDPDGGESLRDVWLQHVHPDDRRRVEAAFAAAAQGGAVYAVCYRVEVRGETRWIHGRAMLERDAQGRPVRMIGASQDVTDQKLTERTLQEYSQRLDLIASQVPGLVYQYRLRPDGSSCFPYASDGIREIYGVSPDDVRDDAAAVFAVIHPDDLEAVAASIEASARHLTPWQCEYRVRRRSGTVRWLYGNSVPRREPDGSTLWHGFITDVTERRLRADLLARSEATLAAFVEHAPAAVAMFDMHMRYLRWSRRWLHDYGLQGQDLAGRSHYAVFPEILDQWKEVHQRSLRGEVVRAERDPFVRADGRVQWLRWEVRPWFDAAGEQGGIVMLTEEITARVEAEAALADREAQLRMLIESLHGVIYRTDCDDERTPQRVSDQVHALVGLRAAEFGPGRHTLAECIHPDDRAAVLDRIRAARVADVPFDLEYRVVRADGTERVVQDRGRVVAAAAGRAACVEGFLVDATEKYETLHRLEEAQRIARVGSWSHDLVAGATSWSAETGRLLAFDQPTVVRPFRQVLRRLQTGAAGALRAAMRTAATAGSPIDVVVTVRDPHAHARCLRVRGQARRSPAGSVVGFVGTVSDITREVTAAEQLRLAHLTAEAASKAKSEFLANMSHEIRTPMTAILGYSELLVTEAEIAADAARRTEHLQRIKDNGLHLTAILDDILDLSKIEAGKMVVERIPVSLPAVLASVVELMTVRSRQKNLPLRVEWRGEPPGPILSDPVRLRQILVNLTANALKFTTDGEVRLAASVDDSPLGGAELRVAVVDTGIGMTTEQVQRLFRAFEQADASTTRRYGGTGLGLRISKRLAAMLKGDIFVQSRPGEGSTFTLVMPIEPAPPEHAAPASAGQPAGAAAAAPGAAEQALAGKRVLLVDDGVDNQVLVSTFLRRVGAEVTIAENGAIALDRLFPPGAAAPTPFDLVVLDMQMPVMDGFATAREIRARGLDAPILALTAHAMPSDRQRCLAAGCTEYTTKPVDRRRLLATLAGLLPAPAGAPGTGAR